MDENEFNSTLKHLPFLVDAPDTVLQEFKVQVSIQKIPARTTVFWEGDSCHSLAILLSGQVRVYKAGESGREITLYRFGQGEGCILTASCIMNDSGFPAIAQVEQDSEAVIISGHVLKDWISRFDIWRKFMFGLLTQRLSDVITTVEEIAFRRMDVRLAEYLITNTNPNNSCLDTTHQEIASELGTVREVVSRILKDFEVQGLVELSRGKIEILSQSILKLKIRNI